MTKKKKTFRPKARQPKGFQDITADELRQVRQMVAKIGDVYESYGFEPLETPAFEYTDALGKFLPDTDRPNAGVFSVADDDEQWMSLRYDMTAPLARYVAQNYQDLAKPFRRYTSGPVWRNEKPGPGRFRQFIQFDADTVGTGNVAADAEICMLASDTLEALGIARGDYIIRVSHRGLLDGILIEIGLEGPEMEARKLVVLRAIDKLDRLGSDGVRALLGAGRKDESGDFTPGAQLEAEQIAAVMDFIENPIDLSRGDTMPGGAVGAQALSDLAAIQALCRGAGFEDDRIRLDQTVVRGLEYYTGPVFEAELTFEVSDDEGQSVRFGSVGGGGRYDDLVARFMGQKVPATGFSIGVSRLQSALNALGQFQHTKVMAPVVVLVMDASEQVRYQKMVQSLRAAGVRAEMYVGTSGMKAQMKYADKRGAPCVVIQGEDERAKGEVQIKDLIRGSQLAEEISDAKEWRETRPAQFSVPEAELVAAVKDVLQRYEN